MHVDIHPELLPAVKKLPPITFKRWNLKLMRFLTRVAPRPRVPADIDVDIDVRAGDGVHVHVYTPRGAQPAAGVLWFHGGGFVIGTPKVDDVRCARLAARLGVRVVSAKYGLAPERPFPHGLDDGYAAWRWMLGPADDLGLDPTRIVVGGASAGGGLAACLAQRIHDEGGPQPAGQLLVYPMLDDRTAVRADIPLKAHPLWNRRSNITGWTSYLGQEPGAPTAPVYSVGARREDVAGLPPAWIGVGSADLFCDEDRAYAERLGEAGVECVYDEVDGAYHGWDLVDPRHETARSFQASQDRFLRERLRL
jgi:acetyl esterase/lipase